jgi:hypothetical protein
VTKKKTTIMAAIMNNCNNIPLKQLRTAGISNNGIASSLLFTPTERPNGYFEAWMRIQSLHHTPCQLIQQPEPIVKNIHDLYFQ